MMSEKRFSDIPSQELKIRKLQANVEYLMDSKKHLLEKINEQQETIQRFEEYVFSDERILCYNCLFCQEKDIYEVKCKIKGNVDVHGTCQYYEKKR